MVQMFQKQNLHISYVNITMWFLLGFSEGFFVASQWTFRDPLEAFWNIPGNFFKASLDILQELSKFPWIKGQRYPEHINLFLSEGFYFICWWGVLGNLLGWLLQNIFVRFSEHLWIIFETFWSNNEISS